MKNYLKEARLAFQENLNRIDARIDPVTYNFYAGMVSLVSGLEVELGDVKARLSRIEDLAQKAAKP